MRQIILITDGRSNEGISPVAAARQAYARGVVVNVIGVTDRESGGMNGEREIRGIADAGGGMHRIVPVSGLSHTMQLMTRHTVAGTIQRIVNEELRTILGSRSASLAALPPDRRAAVVESVDRWTESAPLKVALLIDASASMKHKFAAVREAAADLLLSLRARSGPSELAVLHFPGNEAVRAADVDTEWTTELAKIENILYKLNVKGTTPTGPALLDALELFGREPAVRGQPVRLSAAHEDDAV